MTALALYTTIYPGVERFLPDWYRSVRAQTDLDFQLWIGLDQVEIKDATNAMGDNPEACWVLGQPQDTPAAIRQRALARLVENCDGVVLVDSDDIMHPTRIAAARAMLKRSDLAGCALRLVDVQGVDTGSVLGLPSQTRPDTILPRNNIFGLSNSAIRSDLLGRCLPIPAAVTLVDWFLVTRAWLIGARLAFDRKTRMDYRQHAANMTRITPPYDKAQVARNTDALRRHFRLVQESPPDGSDVHRLVEVAWVASDIETFYKRVVRRPACLERYVESLNKLNTAPLWGLCVANPLLQYMWMSEEEPA